jgi:transcriptional regulator with XRE-family HTH domain
MLVALSVPGDEMPDARMTPETCRAARNMLGLSQAELAARAEVSVVTLRNYENGTTEAPSHATWMRIKRALEQAGVQFIDEDSASHGGGAGVRLKKKGGQPR